MTFSILGTDGSAVGMAVSSSSPAVAARCIHLRAGTGVVASQNVTNPHLGPTLLDLLDRGRSPDQAIAEVVTEEAAEFRQLAVLAPSGSSAAFTGANALGVTGERRGPSAVSLGNMLADPSVVDAALAEFETAEGELEVRLLRALQAGLAAGGEAGPVHSAGLAVVREVPWPETDLRVDWGEHPIEELQALVELWLPQRDDYVLRALRPAEAPGYGVVGAP